MIRELLLECGEHFDRTLFQRCPAGSSLWVPEHELWAQ